MEKHKLEPSSTKTLMGLTAITGFAGGVLWCLFKYLAHAFHFTKIKPAAVLSALKGTQHGWSGFVTTLLFYGVISTVLAFIYYLCLRKMGSFYWGLAFGAVIFVLIFVLHPFLPGIEGYKQYPKNTLITEGCLAVLYGLFIGYSISYEYEELVFAEKLGVKE